MTTFQFIQLTCPNCGSDVKGRRLTSTSYRGQATDLRQIPIGFNPRVFMVNACGTCGFAGTLNAFDETVAPEVAGLIDERLRPIARSAPLRADSKWEFAAQIDKWSGESPNEIASKYLNAAWCADEIDREHFYRRKAAEWFKRALEDGAEDRLLTLYLIGELRRRVGETDRAEEWFDSVIAEAEGIPEAKNLRALAIQQKDAPKEEL